MNGEIQNRCLVVDTLARFSFQDSGADTSHHCTMIQAGHVTVHQ